METKNDINNLRENTELSTENTINNKNKQNHKITSKKMLFNK